MTEQKYLIWGTGTATECFLAGITPEEMNLIVGFVDNSLEKHGKEFLGREIYSPKNIGNISFDKIIIASIYFNEIKKQLMDLGIPEEKIDTYLTFLPNNFSQFLYFEKNKNRLKNKNFSLISNSCFGSLLYRKLGLEYNSPFIGAFIPKHCYLELLSNLEYYLSLELKGTYYPDTNVVNLSPYVYFQFPHAKSFAEVYEKWNRRLERLDLNNLFIHTGFNYFYHTDPSQIYSLDEAQNIQCKNKLFVNEHDYYLTNKGALATPQKGSVDIVSWLNGELLI